MSPKTALTLVPSVSPSPSSSLLDPSSIKDQHWELGIPTNSPWRDGVLGPNATDRKRKQNKGLAGSRVAPISRGLAGYITHHEASFLVPLSVTLNQTYLGYTLDPASLF